MDPAPHAPKSILRALRNIDRDLSVRWTETAEGCRWGVYHSLPKMDGTLEDVVDRLARAAQRAFAEQGQIVPFPNCQQEAFEHIQAYAFVCYVVNEDGSYRPLDQRIVRKLEHMNELRKLTEIGWRQLLASRAATAEAVRQATVEGVWDDIRRDKVAQRVLSDVLWGMRPTRSIYLPPDVQVPAGPERIAACDS